MKSMCDKCNFKSCCEEEKKQINLKEESNNYVIIDLIEKITKILTMNPEELIKLEDFIINNSISLDEKDGIFIVEAFNKKYTFRKISSTFIKEPSIFFELESDERYGKCHSKSLELVLITPNSKIVTGYITENNLHLLHSIIVATELNGDYVYDWTKNLIMSKDEYYKLNKFKVLSEITKDEIIYDKENYADLLVNNICIKPYLVFRNEIVKEIETKKYIKHL